MLLALEPGAGVWPQLRLPWFAYNQKMSPTQHYGNHTKGPGDKEALPEHLFLMRNATQGCCLPQFQEMLLREHGKYDKCYFLESTAAEFPELDPGSAVILMLPLSIT